MNTTSAILDELLGWPPTDPRWTALSHFLERVKIAGIGLVSKSDRDRLIDKHLLPSLETLDLIPETGSLLDVGSGGGFPAIPIALARPNLELVLVESSERKTEFLTRVSRETSLTNVRVICSRIESLGFEHNEQYDIVTAKAVAELPDLIRWTQQLLKPHSKWLLWKGSDWRQEADLASLNLRLVTERPLSTGGRLLLLERIESE